MRRGTRRDRPAAFRPPSEALTGNPARAEHEPAEPVPADAGRAAIEQADVQRGADVPRHLDEAVATDNPGTGSPVDGEVVNLHVPRREQGTDPFEGWAVTRDPQAFGLPTSRREKTEESDEVGDLGTGILAEQQEVARRDRRCPQSLEDAGIGDPCASVFRKSHHYHDLSAPGSRAITHGCPNSDMNLPDSVSGWGQGFSENRKDCIKTGAGITGQPAPGKPVTRVP
jgi:hypothetical protein